MGARYVARLEGSEGRASEVTQPEGPGEKEGVPSCPVLWVIVRLGVHGRDLEGSDDEATEHHPY